jgi:thiamine biosynthesis lipoprotein
LRRAATRRQHVDIDGVRWSHIVDPDTGLGVTESRLVTVVADDGAAADAWATALSVLGPERGFARLPKNVRGPWIVVRPGLGSTS